jgi:hypothetical protein
VKLAILAVLSLIVSGCSAPRTSDYLDAGTTVVALAGGAVEANPLFQIADNNPMGTGVAALAAKVVARTVVDQVVPEDQRGQAHHTFDSFSVGAACNNVGVIVGLSNPVAVGLVCGLTYYVTKSPS